MNMIEVPIIKFFITIFEVFCLLVVSALTYIVKRHFAKVDDLEKDVKKTNERITANEASNIAKCAAIHQRESEKFENMSTKQDVRDLRKDMNDGFENVNNNILSFARSK